MPAYYNPLSYSVCFSDAGKTALLSFQWTYSNEDNSKTFKQERVGPDGGFCEEIVLKESERIHFDLATVFRDEVKIQKVVLL